MAKDAYGALKRAYEKVDELEAKVDSLRAALREIRTLEYRVSLSYDPSYGTSVASAARDATIEAIAEEADQIANHIESGSALEDYANR